METETKLPPEKMELRARPQAVSRLSRKVIILGAGGLMALIGGAFMLALQPPKARGEAQSTELYNVTTKPVADGLAALPATYRDVKPIVAEKMDVLGPPVLGDVARAMVLAEQRESIPSQPDRLAVVQSRSAKPVRTQDSVSTARKSDIFFRRTSGAGNSGLSDKKMLAALLNGSVHQSAKAPLGSGHRLQAGTLIPASLITGINSDLPGPAIAQVTQNVYDSLTGDHVLIPQGAKLIGAYESQINFGQKRAFINWTQIILPDGDAIDLDDLTASDLGGYSGLTDRVDNHTGELVKAGLLSTALGVGAELSLEDDDDDVAEAIREAIQGTANTAGQKVIQRQLSVKPTITIRPGWSFQVIVTSDLQLSAYGP